ncbi:MAG: helix-turn-helix transcriptional regulator [Alphaproteobacteria bacterium]
MASVSTVAARLFTGFADAARAIGTPRFHAALLGVLKGITPWDAAEIVRYSRYAAPDFLEHEGIDPAHVQTFMAGYYRFDPFFGWWREHGRADVLTLRGASRPDDLGGPYFTAFLPRTGITDTLGLFLPTTGGCAIALFLESYGRRFTAAAVRRVKRAFPLFLALHETHMERALTDLRLGERRAHGDRAVAIFDREGREVFASPAWENALAARSELRTAADALLRDAAAGRQVHTGPIQAEPLGQRSSLAPEGTILVFEPGAPALPPLDFDAAFGSFARGTLTRRETQIARLILTGYPTAAIAKVLGIGRGTVKNHRRRLYDRLDITTERELFSLFLETLTKPKVA